VFRSKRNADRDLPAPAEVEGDPNATEVLRAWVANGGLVCALRPETWKDASSWGIVLADVARHVANAVKDVNGDDPAITVARIRAMFNRELSDPTDEATGHF
jgi:hypothetical protein